MEPTSPEQSRLLVTSGTTSWEREGARDEHDLLADFLEDVAASETIQTAISRSIAAMHLRTGDRVLDVGCGTGVIFPEVVRAIGSTGQIVGIDHGSGFLDDARQRSVDGGFGNQVALFQGDAHVLPFEDDSFDAAHTERVLIHLADPDRALAEMARVVKPGGWISCVEPDLVGMRMEHTQPELGAAVISGFCASIRNPAMGLELNRRLLRCGLTDISVEVLTEVERSLTDDDMAFYRNAGDRAVELGLLTKTTAAQALDEMRRASACGYFVSYSSMFIVSGRVRER